MINGSMDQFLDTGWFSEAALYWKGYVYWCEASSNGESPVTTFIVDKWPAINENNKCYHSVLNTDGTLSWERVFEISNVSMDHIKRRFLEAKIFNNKSFWEVEKEIAWLDDGGNIIK